MNKFILTMAFIAIGIAICPPQAHALNKKDLQILGRALGFIENGPSGDIQIGIVQNIDNPHSVLEANDMISLINGGIHSGRLNIHAKKITPNAASTGKFPVLYFTQGTEAQQSQIFNAVTTKGVITVSTHESCLTSKSCVLVIQSMPTVNIKVSKAAARSTGVSFGSAFRMMVSEH